jgi:hypothetical protein
VLLDRGIIGVLFLGDLCQGSHNEFEAGNRQQQQIVNEQHTLKMQ